MSQASQQIINQTIKLLFQDKNLTGYQIAKNNQVATIVKRDSTDFANQLIRHNRGRQIICELVDIVLRPHLTIDAIKAQKQQPEPQNKNIKSFFQNNFTTSIIYNSVQILTNQYEEFVQYVFQEDKKSNKNNDQLQSPTFPQIKIYSNFPEGEMNIENNNFKGQQNNKNSKKSQQGRNNQQKSENKHSKQGEEQQNWDDCVIMDSNFPQLTKNQEDSVLRRIADMSKLNQFDFLKCSILDRMFLLFDSSEIIEETPVSYFNKIMLQFVYQRPQQIMRFFYCDKQIKGTKTINCQKIRKISKHFYNSSIVQLIVHIMQLQNQGNFFVQQKIQIFKTIVEQVFTFGDSQLKNKLTQDQNELQQKSTASQLLQSKIKNYVLLLKSLFQKLQDRYQQQKFLPIFKYHLNDQKLMQKIIGYFFYNFNYFDMSGLLNLLIQMLKMDKINFRLHKLSTQSTGPFGNHNNVSFNNNTQESSIASYDLKLSTQILDQIQNVILKLTTKFQQWEGSTMRMVEYYELIHSWMNVTMKQIQNNKRKNLITACFINECLYKVQSHPNSTILHNVIKNILVDFLPKINQSIKLIFSPGCQLIPFIQKYVQENKSKEKKKKRKCFQNQLYHICKTILSIWQQHKILNTIRKTQDDSQDQSQKYPSQHPISPTSDGQNVIRFQNLKAIICARQQFYEHLICGDPRKIGQYQEEESSQIIMTSSIKNFTKPDFFKSSQNNDAPKITTSNRYAQESQSGDKQRNDAKKEDFNVKKQTSMKSTKFRNLRLGDETNSNNLFQAAISPLNANCSHVMNFDFDALPLDSDNSEQCISEQQNDQIGKNQMDNQEQIKLMQQNIQNMDILSSDILQVQSNILSSSNSINNDKNLLNCQNYRKDQLSKSMDIPDSQIQKVDSYLLVHSPRKQSQEQLFSLGLDSKQSGSKLSDENKGSNIQNLVSQLQSKIIINKQDKDNDNQTETVDSNFVKHYSSYLQYDLTKLCQEVQLN